MSNFVITKVTAFVAIDPVNGDEGVLGFKGPDSWIPLICADEKRIEQMFAMAQDITAHAGISYKIIQFSTREDVTDEVKEKYLK